MINVTKIARKNSVKGQQATKFVKSLNINDAINKKTRQYSFSTSETLPLPIFSIIFHSFVNNAANAARTCQRPHTTCRWKLRDDVTYMYVYANQTYIS